MRNHLALGLSLFLAVGTAPADPVGSVVNGVAGVLNGVVGGVTGAAAGGTAGIGSGSLVALPPLLGAGNALNTELPIDLASPTALPGLDQAAVDTGGVLGVSVLQPGADGSVGYSDRDVLTLGPETVIGPQADGLLSGPVAGGGNDTVEIAILDGNGAATGGTVGIAVLSGSDSGSGSGLGVGVLNQDDLGHICVGGQCGSSSQLFDATGLNEQQEVAPGVVVGGGEDTPVTSSNEYVNVGALTGDNAGTGGMVGVGVIAGDNSGQGTLAGACVLCGDNSGIGTGVAVPEQLASATGISSVGVGAAVLSGANSGIGTDVPLSGVTGPLQPVLGNLPPEVTGLLPDSINLGVGLLNGSGTTDGFANGSLFQRNDVSKGLTSGGEDGVAALLPEGDVSTDSDDFAVAADDAGETDEDALDWRRGACLIVVKNVKDQTTQSMQRRCKGRRAG